MHRRQAIHTVIAAALVGCDRAEQAAPQKAAALAPASASNTAGATAFSVDEPVDDGFSGCTA